VFLFVLLAAGIVLAVILGGDIRRLGQIRLKHPELLVAAFVLRGGVVLLGATHSLALVNLARPLNVFVAIFLIAVVWMNRHLPGAILFGVGQGLNLIAIVAFGGRMPVLFLTPPGGVDPVQASARLELLRKGFDPLHVYLSHPTGLWFMGDIFDIPLLHHITIVSVGDLVMVAGVIWLVIRLSQPAVPSAVSLPKAPA
jgi:Family of unknown function (DUF5317)